MAKCNKQRDVYICYKEGLLLKNEKASFDLAVGFAAALMVVDSYNPSSFVPAGLMDERDASKWLTKVDILNGCQRSLVNFIVKQIPCKCLDELYAQIKSKLPKMGICEERED